MFSNLSDKSRNNIVLWFIIVFAVVVGFIVTCFVQTENLEYVKLLAKVGFIVYLPSLFIMPKVAKWEDYGFYNSYGENLFVYFCLSLIITLGAGLIIPALYLAFSWAFL